MSLFSSYTFFSLIQISAVFYPVSVFLLLSFLSIDTLETLIKSQREKSLILFHVPLFLTSIYRLSDFLRHANVWSILSICRRGYRDLFSQTSRAGRIVKGEYFGIKKMRLSVCECKKKGGKKIWIVPISLVKRVTCTRARHIYNRS